MNYSPQAFHTEFARSYRSPEAYHEYALEHGRDVVAGHVARVVLEETHGTHREVLDLAAGTGILSARLSEFGCDVTATDADPEMIRFLTERLPDVHAQELDFNEPFRLPDATYDAVVTLWANRYLSREGTKNFINETNRVLKPGGKLIWPFFSVDHILWRLRAGGTTTTSMRGIAREAASSNYTDIRINRDHRRLYNKSRIYPAYLIARKASVIPAAEQHEVQ